MINYNVEVDIVEERTTIIEELLSPTFLALASGVAAATVIVILLLGLICHRLCKAKPGYTIAKDDADIDLNKLAENSNYHTTGAQIHPKLELLEYPRNDIIYIRDIGQGAFGRVFQVFIQHPIIVYLILILTGQGSRAAARRRVHNCGSEDVKRRSFRRHGSRF